TADTKRTTAVDEATVDKRTTATDEATVDERTTAVNKTTDTKRTTAADEATVDKRTTAAKRIDTSSQTVLLFGLEVDDTSRRSLSRKKIRKLLKRTRKIPDSQAESREADFEDLVTPSCDFDWQEDKWKKKIGPTRGRSLHSNVAVMAGGNGSCEKCDSIRR
ncbi:uncharacterized protein BCR38DRAFT_504439, partial [Pseudomassariella vexata]